MTGIRIPAAAGIRQSLLDTSSGKSPSEDGSPDQVSRRFPYPIPLSAATSCFQYMSASVMDMTSGSSPDAIISPSLVICILGRLSDFQRKAEIFHVLLCCRRLSSQTSLLLLVPAGNVGNHKAACPLRCCCCACLCGFSCHSHSARIASRCPGLAGGMIRRRSG